MHVKIDAGLGLPELSPRHRLSRLLATALPTGAAGLVDSKACPAEASCVHWPAGHFHLDQVDLYREAPPQARAAVLERLGRGLIEEAYFIEKAGTGFAAKMILLATSTEERMLYGLFAADEARHLAMIGRFLDRQADPRGQPFLGLLGEIIEAGDRASLQLLIQVLLEGWGLAHYRALQRGCRTSELKAVFDAILEDETRHHGSGVLLLEDQVIPPQSRTYVDEVLSRFLDMVRRGPQNVLDALDREIGLTRAQRIEVYEALDGEAHGAERLSLLRRLLGKARGDGWGRELIDRFERHGAFLPFTAEECA